MWTIHRYLRVDNTQVLKLIRVDNTRYLRVDITQVLKSVQYKVLKSGQYTGT